MSIEDQIKEIKRLWVDAPAWTTAPDSTGCSAGMGIESEVRVDDDDQEFICACAVGDDVNAYRIALAPSHIKLLLNVVERSKVPGDSDLHQSWIEYRDRAWDAGLSAYSYLNWLEEKCKQNRDKEEETRSIIVDLDNQNRRLQARIKRLNELMQEVVNQLKSDE